MEAGGDAAQVLSWAFSALAEDGVSALERVAREFAWLDDVPLHDLTLVGSLPPAAVMEARELMTTLLSISPSFASPAQLSLYVVIVARVHVALFVETLARKQRAEGARATLSLDDDAVRGEGGAPAESRALASAFTTMQAWSRDLVALFTHSILPQLCFRDAQPHTITTTQQLTPCVPPPSLCADAVKGDNDNVAVPGAEAGCADEVQQHKLLCRAFVDYNVPAALTRLVDAVFRTTRDCTVCPLLLAVYATLHHMEAYAALPSHDSASSASSEASTVLRRWQRRFFCETAGVWGGVGEKRVTEVQSTTRAAAEEVTQESRNVCALEETSARKLLLLLDEVVSTVKMLDVADAWSFVILQLSRPSCPARDASTMFATDVERGEAPPDVTAALLAKEHEEEVDACTLVEVDHLDAFTAEDEADDALSQSVLSLSLCRHGALFLLADVLRGTDVGPPALYTASSTTLLLCAADAYTVALTCTSRAGLMRHLLLLHDLIVTIPKYSLDCAEDVVAQGSPPALSGRRAFDTCSTRRYEALFAIEKGLLSVSALCSCEDHRRVARGIGLELLERLKEEPRVRMHLSLLTLCPYPSIARFFLERLLDDWREQQQQEQPTSVALPESSLASSPLAYMVPMGLSECMRTFLQHLASGTRGFLDPLIVSLNFIRVAASRHAWIRAIVQKSQKTAVSQQRSVFRHHSQRQETLTASSAWVHLFGVVKSDVLPRCDTMTNPPAVAAASPFALPPLSPLDAFSLSSAVDGVKAVFA
jgi:hypothetical protein